MLFLICWLVVKYVWNWKGSGSMVLCLVWLMMVYCVCVLMVRNVCCMLVKLV